MKKARKGIKAFFAEKVNVAYFLVILITAVFAIVAAFLEFTTAFSGGNFASFMKKVFSGDGTVRNAKFYRAAYFIFIYVLIALYCIFAMLLCVKKNETAWCALVIVISLIFIIVMHLCLTILFQDKNSAMNERMYGSLTNCCVSLAMIVSTIAGIKMTYILGKNRSSRVMKKEIVEKTVGDKIFVKEAARYYYVENEADIPDDGGNYWHYVDGEPTPW